MACRHTNKTDVPCSQCAGVRVRRLDPVETAPIRITRSHGRAQINRHDFWARFWTQARSWRSA